MPDIRNTIRNPGCELCPLHEGARHVCLMGSGPTDTRIVLVGEAPGEREDAEHRAFVGRSGQLLNKALSEVGGIERDDCYVTNVVKCRPPDNRTPERKEAKVCAENYLKPELEAIKPRFVLLLGNSALQAVIGKSGITKVHGTVYQRTFGGVKAQVMATVHPAMVLRNPKWAAAFGMDIQRFGKLTRGEETGLKTRVLLANTKESLAQLRDALMEADRISWDIETYTKPTDPPYVRSNFQEWHGPDSMIVSIAFCWEPGLAVAVPVHHPEARWRNPDAVLKFLAPALTRDDCEYVAHNGKFDARWMNANGIVVPQTFDTMLASHMLDENRPKGLKPLSHTLLGADSYDVGEELKDASAMPLKRLAIYNAKDTDYTLRLREVLAPQLNEVPRVRRVYRKLMMPASEALVEIERTGVYIDPERWRERHDKALETRDMIDDYINRKWVPRDLRPINFNSPQQVARILFDELGLPVIMKTDKGHPSTAEKVLLRLASRHKMPLAMIKYRKWAKYLSTYLLPWWYEHRDSDGRIHSNYKLFGTVTGRLSGEGGIQQVPRDTFIRGIIGAEPGWMFVQADYSQVELRIAAMIADEAEMLRAYAAGEDIHMNTAVSITGKDVADIEKEERKKAKGVNFGFIYGMSWKKFVDYAFDSYGVTLTDEEAELYRERFFDTYPELIHWHEHQRGLAQQYRQVSSPLGRVRHLPDILSQDKDVRSEAERQAINSPVQSMASDLMLSSLITLHSQMRRTGQARIVGTVHDSILFEVREGYVDRWCRRIKDTMEDMDRVKRDFKCDITVPIIADVEVGTHWSEGEPWESK